MDFHDKASSDSPKLEDTGERIIPQNARDTIDYAEHLVRYQFAARLAAGKRVLDVACGVGYGSKLLAETHPTAHIQGIDLSAAAIDFARQHHPAPNLRYTVGSALELPFEDGSFDLVVAFEFIEHIEAQLPFLEGARRVLAPGGILVVSTPNRVMSVGRNPFHVHELVEHEFCGMLGEHFPYVTTLYQSNVLTSMLKPRIATVEARQVRNGFTTIVGDPFHGEEAMFLVAVCSDRPLDAAIHEFDGGVCVTRNEEFHKVRGLLAERDRALGIKAERELRSDQLIHSLRTQVYLLERTLADRERQVATLEADLHRDESSRREATEAIASLTQSLERTLRESSTTIEVLTRGLEVSTAAMAEERRLSQSISRRWGANLEVISQALDRL